MPSYKYNGNTYDIPADKVADFEAQYQNATMAYKDGDTIYDIPVSKRDKFLSKYPNAIQWDDQTQKNTLETNLADFSAQYGDFMSEYENFEKHLKAPEMEPEYLPNYEAHMAKADEYNLRRSEREKMLKEYFSNPLVIKEREGRAGDARLMAESFAAAAGRMEQDNPELARKAKASNAAAMNPRGGMIGFIGDDVKQYNEDHANYETARRFATEAQEIYAAPSKYDDSVGVVNFLKGAKNVANSADFWTMGMSGIADNLNARDALAKVQEKLGSVDNLTEDNISQVLSPSEAALVTAWAANVDAQARRAEDLSRGYQAGQGATESLGFMAQFLLTGGAGKTVSEAATKGIMKWLAGQLGKMSSGAVKSVAKGAAKGVLGTVKSLTKAAVQTPLMPSTYGNISEVMLEIDDSGKLIEADQAFWTGLADSMIETWSESAGGMVEEILGVPLKLGSKAWNKALGETSFGKWGQSLTRTPAYNLMKQAGWNGYIGELGEEWLGNSVRTLTGLDPDALKDFATVDQQIVTMTSFAPMAVLGLGASAAQYTAAKNRAANAAEALSGVLQQAGYSQDQISFVLDDMNASTPRQLSETLTPVVNQIAADTGFGSEAFKAVMNYADAMARYRTLDGFYQREQESKMLDARGDIESKTKQLFYQIHDTGKPSVTGDGNVYIEEVRVVENSDGSRFFVVGQSEDGTLAAVDEQGGKRFITEDEITKQFEDGSITSDQTMMLRDFLRAEVVRNQQTAEQARMTEDARNAVAQIRQIARPGEEVNLGTAEAPVMGVVAQITADGVVVQTEAGVSQLSWEEAGHVFGIDATPRTDKEIEAGEVAQIEAARAERMTRLAQSTDEAAGAAIEALDAQIEESVAKPLPLKADGSVDQTTLWNQNPARWAKWNDEQRNDGGANSLNYISGAVAKEQAAIAEMMNAYNAESDFDARDLMETEIQKRQARLNELMSLQAGYMQATQQTVQQTAAVAEEKPAPVPQTPQEVRDAENKRREPLRRRAQDLSKKLGVKVNIAESLADVKEQAAREQIIASELKGRKNVSGWVNVETGEVTIYLPHTSSEAEVESTFIHEFVAHKGLRELLGPEGFNALCDSVWEMMSESDRNAYLNYPGVNGDTRKAADEYIAHFAEGVNVEEQSVWDKIVDTVRKILSSMGIDLAMSNSDLANIIRESYQNMRRAADAAVQQQETAETELEADAEAVLNEDGFEIDEQNEDVRFSVRYLPTDEQKEQIIDSIVEITGRPRDVAERWLNSELSLAAIVLNDKEYLDYAPDAKYKAIKDNSDYPQGTVDFNNICRKRNLFTQMFTRLQRAYPNRIFTAENLADIRTVMSEDGLTVACGLCYVEDRRQKLGEVANAFIEDLQDGFRNYAKKNATKKANAAQFAVLVSGDTYVPSIYDLITLEGSDKLYEEHRGIWEAFGAYNRARGQQTQNTFQGYAEYKREILTWSDAKVKKVNSLGGLRIFSYSDFEAHHLLDIIQIIIDCAARGVMIQGYTKVPEFARVVEKTGIKLNRSLIPLGDTGIVDGKLAYDPVEGIDINDPNFLESNDNVGNILIGINDEQIRLAMADPFIHYIIPYHARQAGNIRAKLNVGAWTNYIDTQNERKMSDGKRVEKNMNIYTDVLDESITNDREFVEKYLEVCREKGYIPKFDQFLDKDAEGNYVYTPGYYKFLVDFKLFDEQGNILPQKPVIAEFDDAFNAQILADYAKEQRETTGEQLNSTYDKIVDTLDLGEPEGTNVKFGETVGSIDVLEEARKIVEREDGVAFRVISDENYEMAQRIINNLAGDTYFRRLEGEYELGKLASNYAELADIIMAIDANKNYTPVGTALLGFFAENPDMHFPLLFNDSAMSKETANAFAEELSKVNDPYALFFMRDAWRIHKTSLEQAGLGVKASSTTKYNKAIDARAEEIKAAEVKGTAFNFKKQESSLDEIDAIFKQLNKDPELALLHDKVMGVARELGVKVSFAGKRGRTAGESLGDKVSYDYKFFNSPAVADQKKCNTITHELIHSITVYAIYLENQAPTALTDGMLQAVGILRDVYNQIARDPAFKGEYGVSDVYEMVAELSNAQFRDKLKEKNLFQRILDALKRLLGIDTVKEDSAYQVLSDTLNYIIDNYDQAAFDAYALYASKNKSYGRMMKIEETPRFRITPEMDKAYMDAVERGDMETAQRMVIEAAKLAMPNTKVPGIIYHGTRSNNGERPYSTITAGHFTDDYGFAEYYANASGEGFVYNTFLNIEHPLVYDFKGQNSDNAVDENGERITTFSIIDRARQDGNYDGVILKNVDEYGAGVEEEDGEYPGTITDIIPLSPSQIKSADPVTYDDAGNVIPLSERFNPEKEDIRFRVTEDGKPIHNLQSRINVPKVRGGWTEAKILRYLKQHGSREGVRTASMAIAQFDSVEELKEHMFYHGSQGGAGVLKPSITMSDREIERIGGGGYGDKYWGISVSKSKEIASRFSSGSSVRIYPIILLKDAKVIERPDFSDAWDAGEHIVELWNEGVDAVWIGNGKQGGGEQELLVLNPRAIVNINTADFYRYYKLGSAENPLRIADDEAIERMYATAKEYASTYQPRKPIRPMKPWAPSRIDDNLNRKSEEQYQSEVEEYNRALEQYERDMQAYEDALKVYNESDEKKAFDILEAKARQDIRFRISNDNQAIFVSNAARAVEAIKQEKATPEQWLKMIEKAGGLKAGEDKWMGLSDWLKASDKKTLTKQEVLDYINENMIIIEEQHYSNEEVAASANKELNDKYPGWDEAFSMEWDTYMDEPYASVWDAEIAVELYNDYHEDQIELDEDGEFQSMEDEDKVAAFGKEIAEIYYRGNSDVRPIHGTRSDYQTRGLSDNHEIALTVPNIERWKADDAVHFGDAGDGRAIAWIRFGETKYRPAGIADEIAALDKAILEYEGETSDEEYKALVEKKHSLLRASRAQKVLVIDEIQSKRHQEGRDNGYTTRTKIAEHNTEHERLREEAKKATSELFDFIGYLVAKYPNTEYSIESARGNLGRYSVEDRLKFAELEDKRRDADYVFARHPAVLSGVPDAPFDKNWHELAMKRMLRYAAENGYDVIAWTKGEQQAERYGLQSIIDDIWLGEWQDTPSGKARALMLYHKNGHQDGMSVGEDGIIIGGSFKGSSLSDVVGKELAIRFLSEEGAKRFKGEEIKVGGEGMKGFYDKMLPAFMNKYGKKWGVKVEDIELPNLKDGLTMHSVPVTEEMKASVMKGQVMFRVRGENESAEEFVQSEIDRLVKDYNPVAPIRIADLSSREALVKSLGIEPERLSEEDYQATLQIARERIAAYNPELDIVAIFVPEAIADSRRADDLFFHENGHAIVKRNPRLVALGQWLFENSEKGVRKIIAKSVREDYAEANHHEEMLTNYAGKMMASGRSREVMDMLPDDMKPLWDEFLTKSNYNSDYEDRLRRELYSGRTAGNRAESEGVQMRNGNVDDRQRPKVTWTRDEFDSDLRFRTTEITPEVRDEMDTIAATAIVNGNYMKAPNGADTNLTAEQWAMVRTKNFKNWFGDWENDPENASKVVDENGEPKVVFHGGAWRPLLEEKGNAVFKLRGGLMGKGAYFTDKLSTAIEYARDKYGWEHDEEVSDEFLDDNGYVTEVFLNIRNEDNIREYYGETFYLATNHGQIKSAIANTGEFSLNFDIRFRINENPTEAQKEAGNYKMGHLNLDGYRITIENPKGSVRRGTDSKGNAWENTLNNDYGYIRGTEGVDGDHIDVYLSDNPSEGNVFVIDQVNPETREFDEHKVMYGFNSAEEAREAYLANFSEGWNGLGTITEVSKDEFKKWIQSSHRKTKPFSEYKSVNAISSQSEGMEDEVMLRVTGTPTDDVVASGLSLSPAQTADLAGNIFAALSEESRKKITDGLNGNILGLQDAIMQIPASLAVKENWNDEDKAVAEVIAEQMTNVVDKDMTRPFSAKEALWTLYNATHKDNDIISEASRALVRSNLGFDSQTLGIIDEAKDGVRFRTVGDASANAEASLYNRGAANVWTRLKESYVDMNASVEKLMKSIEKASGKVAQGFENILMALNQQSSKGLAAMESYTEKFLNPMFDEIVKIMKKAGKSYQDVVRYVILKHGLERNIKLAQRDAKAHYQEIYDDIISKITGMNDAQKRTYLTNAQLKEADAKAELARLQAVDQSTLTDDQLRELKRDLAKARKAVTEAEENLKRAEKIRNMSEQEAQDELGKIFEQIESGKDSVYKELRNKDYSGISSMFYDQLGVDRRKYSTEEEYQAALMLAKEDRFSTLADVEAEAKKEVSEFENVAETKALWKRINAATKETLRQQYEANMISKDQYESLKNMFDFYVPLRGFKDNTAEDMYTYYRKPNSTGYTKPILGAEGRKTEAESPFGWIASMAGSAIASNVKNEAKLALYYFVSNRPDNGIATVSKTWFVHTPGDVDANGKRIFRPAYPTFNEDLSTDAAKQAYEDWQENMKELQKQGLAYESGQRLNLGNAVVNIDSKNQPEHIVTVKVGGKDYTIVINGNPRAAQAINGDLNIESTASDYSAVFGPVLRWMSSVNTSYNPEFWITNTMRDMLFTMMSVNIKEDPAYRRTFRKNYWKAWQVVSLTAKNEKGTIGDSYMEKMYKDFVKYGGVTGYTQIKDSETWEKEIDRYLKSNNAEDVKAGVAMKRMKDGFHAMHRFGESLEQVSRFAAFVTAREQGKSIAEAVNDAKEITVNFNRKGSGKMISLEEAKTLTNDKGQPLKPWQQWAVVGLSSIAPLGRRTIMFFNAAIQGLNATYKLYAKNKTRAIGWALGYAAIGMIQALLHAMMDDDDDYLDMPQYERRNALMIGGNGVYFKWALPQEARAFYALGDLAVESVMGRNPHQNVIGEAIKIGTEVLPVNPTEGWRAFLPSVAIPAIELMINEDYKGAPIYSDQKWLTEEERKRTAKWANAKKGTGKMYVELARLLNNVSGGDQYDAGAINIQPEKVEHIVQSAFGGTIRTADKFFSTVMAAIDPEEEVTMRQFPFLNRFLTINDERYKNVHVNDVYDYYAAEAEHVKTLQKKYAKDMEKESLDRLRQSDEFRWMQIYSKYEKAIEGMQERIRAAEGTSERMELMKEQDEIKRRMIKEISQLP